jgi:hypothetical protein
MALSNVPNIDAIIDGFPKKPPKVMGTPTFTTLNQLKLDLQDNASLVPSNLGGAQNSYLGLILATPAYHAIVGNDANGDPQPFIAPMFPGAVPTITGINDVAREAKLQKFEVNTYTWCKYDIGQGPTKAYYCSSGQCLHQGQEEQGIGLQQGNNQSAIGPPLHPVWRHQHNNLANNDTHFSEPWDGVEPFENISECFDDCIEFAKAALLLYTRH